jgi:hypothetical protein
MYVCRAMLRPLAVLTPLLGAALCAQVTESPQTVGPGKWLLETEALHFDLDQDDVAGPTTTALGLASSILSTGLTDAVDLQFGVSLYRREDADSGGARDTTTGLQHLDLRAKWKFWSDDRRGSALAAIPYLKLPVNSGGYGTDTLEGGLMLPYSLQISGKVTAGAMGQWDLARNEADNGYDSRWLLTGYTEYRFATTFSVYGEATAITSSAGGSDWSGTLGVGLLWQVTKSVQLDYELQRGIRDREVEWLHALRLNWAW